MQPFTFTAEEVASVVAAVVALTEIIKFKVPEKHGLAIAMIISGLGVAAFTASKPEFTFTRFVVWPLFVAYITVLAGAAGVFSIIKNVRGSDAMSSTPKMIALLLIPTVLFGSACARRDPNLSPERSIALYSTQVAGYLRETKTVADGLFAGNVINKDQYTKVLEVLVKANEAGVTLTSALQAYDAATDGIAKGDAAKQVDAALITLNTILPNILSEVTNAEGRAKIGQVIDSVQRLILTIARATLPRTTAEKFDVELPRDHWWYNTPVEAN